MAWPAPRGSVLIMGRRWSWLVVGMVGLGCTAWPGPESEPLTPEDKARAIEAWQASEGARRAAGVRGGATLQTHCIGSSRIAQLEARQQRHRGAAGFDHQGCGPGD